MADPARGTSPERPALPLALAALGVVFGDIGTSPLYALHVCFAPGSGLAPTEANVLGVLSLVCWALIVVVSIKYVVFVMRADLRGEGGILALMALALGGATSRRGRAVLVGCGLFGAALLYGDGMITPAISVLSAVEGIKLATPMAEPVVLLLTVAVLTVLFWVQRRGSGQVGAVFGPVMLVWFAVIALLGLDWIGGAPQVLTAVDPRHALQFLLGNGEHAYFLLGSVFLVVTGGEALYADIGHFGTRPIRQMWFLVVLPAVLLNYYGQGAMLLQQPGTVHHTFFSMAPAWGLIPLVGLATAAAVIASQAIIAGAFSLTTQALQLGYVPRLTVRHPSADEEGQVYVPLVNWLLYAAAVGLVLAFRTSDALANAYGIAVSGTMVLTTLLAFVYFHRLWGWLPGLAIGALLLPIDLAFFGANLAKVDHGGWLPLLVAGLGFLIFSTWQRGQGLAAAQLDRVQEDEFLAKLTKIAPLRVPGTAVCLTRGRSGVPRILLQNMQHNHVLHQHVVLLTIEVESLPRVHPQERLEIRRLTPEVTVLTAHYGYMQRPNVPLLLREAAGSGIPIDLADLTYFLARLRVIPTSAPGMARWRKRLYAFLSRNAYPATASYRIPAEQTFEVSATVEI
ncbi:MAG: potassium transporter Kup [Candidatus Binatia bacterium]